MNANAKTLPVLPEEAIPRSRVAVGSALRRRNTGDLIELDAVRVLGAGGEARILELHENETLLAKVYRRPTVQRARKLEAMLANPPDDPTAAQGHISVAWPIDLLETASTPPQIVGFLMARASGTRPLIDFFNPMTRREHCPLFDYSYLMRTARNLAISVRAVHARGYVIGDVNESNILATETALVTLVDTDSFQVRDSESDIIYPCPVGRPEYMPPELQGKNLSDTVLRTEHDLFGLAILIFQILMEGTHPFAGIYTGDDDPPAYEERIASGHYTYRTDQYIYRPMPAAPPFELLTPRLRATFARCFEDGHEFPSARLDAQAWVEALREAESELVDCVVNRQHRHGVHLEACPWCERARFFGGRDPFPSRWAVESGDYLTGYEPGPTTDVVSGGRSLSEDTAVEEPVETTDGTAPAVPTQLDPWRAIGRLRGMAHRMQLAAMLSASAAMLAVAVNAGVLRSARSHLRTEILGANTELALAADDLAMYQRAGHRAPASGGLVRGRLRKCRSAFDQARRAISLDPDDSAAVDVWFRARQMLKQAVADNEAQEARSLVDQVAEEIARVNTEPAGPDQQAVWQDKLKSANEHAGRALDRDPKNEAAWVERVRAMRILDPRRALYEVRRALSQLPNSQELAELDDQIRSQR